jgi:hypothetical protein
MRKRPKLKMAPELVVEANRWANELVDGRIGRLDGFSFLKHPPESSFTSFTSSDVMQIIARRIEELRTRGYPEAWIQRDIEKLTEGL